MATENEAMGALRIDLQVPSVLLTDHLEVQVRDARMRLIETVKNAAVVKVPAGVYEVSAVLTDGQRHTHHVRVTPGSTAKAELRSPHLDYMEAAPASVLERTQFRSKLDTIPAVPPTEVKLCDLHGATLRQTSGREWVFVAERAQEVPYATFGYGGRCWQVSLPINPGFSDDRGAAVVRTSALWDGLEVRAWFAPRREVSSALQHMLVANRPMHALRLADEATELLRGKYRDPVGAALGAILLHKMGRLGERREWLKNLARDFPWLPDGKVLLASLLSREVATRKRGLNLLMEVKGKRLMFGETLSISVDLLRRWPGGKHPKRRARALKRLSPTVSRADWEATTLTFEDVECSTCT